MSVIEQVFEEELDRSIRLRMAMEREMELLPKGSIRKRMIRGNVYYYLTHREGSKVLSDYVRADDVEELSEKIRRRRELKEGIAEQKMNEKRLLRALGRRGKDE